MICWVYHEFYHTIGIMSSGALRDNDVISISHKLTTLEMKELNERQRADHSTHMYEQQKQQLRTLEDRNFDLELKFSEVMMWKKQ